MHIKAFSFLSSTVSLAISKTAIKIKDDNKKGLTEPENVGIYLTILFLIVVLINIFRFCLQQEIAKNGNISEC